MPDRTTTQLDLTVIILTLNEEAHLSDCLESARLLTDRILVLDSGSTDRTREIANEAGADVRVRSFSGYADQRNAALKMVGSEWVLFLDADEQLTPELAEEVWGCLKDTPDKVAGFRIPRRNLLGSRALRGGGWWPDAQLRLFRRAAANYDPEFQIHERAVVPDEDRLLSNPMIHHNFASLAEFRATQRRYLPMLVEQHRQSGDFGRRRTVFGRPLREFWRRFISLKGYRDGFLGLYLAMAMAWYEFQMWRGIRSRSATQTIDRSIAARPSLTPPDPALDISVIITSYNTSELLIRCLASIEAWFVASDRTGEVIVVDNGSVDGTVNMLKRRFPEVRLIENGFNAGYAAANNQGIAAAKGKYLVLLNADTTVVGDAFGTLARYLDQHPETAIVGPQLRYPDGSVQSSRRRFPTRLTGFLESTLIQEWWPDNRVLRRYYVADRSDAETQEVDWLVGACLMVRREAIEQVGGLDEQFFMYSEEVDWCHRMRQAGWRIAYHPAAVVTHHEGASSRQNVPARQINFDTSKVLLHRKLHGPAIARLLHLFLLWTYLLRIAIEAGKGMIGHKRQLRQQRVSMYWRVLLTRMGRSRRSKGTS